MNLTITYNELSELVNNKVSIRPIFTAVDKKTLKASYRSANFMPTICVRFQIEAMYNNIICISYDCGTATSLVIASFVAYLEKKIPRGIEVNTTDKRVNIYTHRFKQIEKALEYVALSNITFNENSANIELMML